VRPCLTISLCWREHCARKTVRACIILSRCKRLLCLPLQHTTEHCAKRARIKPPSNVLRNSPRFDDIVAFVTSLQRCNAGLCYANGPGPGGQPQSAMWKAASLIVNPYTHKAFDREPGQLSTSAR
jgi:hypothetical protein